LNVCRNSARNGAIVDRSANELRALLESSSKVSVFGERNAGPTRGLADKVAYTEVRPQLRRAAPRIGRVDVVQYQSGKGNALNTSELVAAVAAANDLPKAKAKEIVQSIVDSIVEAAKRGDEVVINGFGRFSLKERAARIGRNPRTGEILNIPASRSLGFKMSKPVGAAI
jgi:DNA-binding protein HU-beta